MEIGGSLLALGLIVTVVSFTYGFVEPTPGWLQGYAGVMERPEGNYNLILFILGPILVLTGGFYLGEQIVLRRRFERLLDTPKRSEFTSRRRTLEQLARRLPSGYAKRLDEKEGEFTSRRA